VGANVVAIVLSLDARLLATRSQQVLDV